MDITSTGKLQEKETTDKVTIQTATTFYVITGKLFSLIFSQEKGLP